jgi:(p)ppGpp synthase/HD superfamily hydrolase
MEQGKDLVKRALDFAERKHAGQKRKFTDIDYFQHPLAVGVAVGSALYIEDSPTKEKWEIMAAAFLHDVLEDTDATYRDIFEAFGKNVAELVKELTIDKALKKTMGKKDYLVESMSLMSDAAFLIKLADRIDNVFGLQDNDIPKKFVKWYVTETEYIIKNLERSINEDHKALLGKLLGVISLVRSKRGV